MRQRCLIKHFRRFCSNDIPSNRQSGPGIKIGGGGIDIGKNESLHGHGGLPWEPHTIHGEKPAQGYMNIDGFFDNKLKIDGTDYNHSVLILPQFIVKWNNITNINDIKPEHFSLCCIHYPAIRHIFVGCGYTLPCPTPLEWIDYLNKYRISIELLTVQSAMRLFNMQNVLERNFACAIVYEPEVASRLHSVVRKVDLGMEDPMDPFAHKRSSPFYQD